MFHGQVALVTGASRGIGFGIAETLLEHGARVCITARNPEQLRAALDRLAAEEYAIAVPGASDDSGHRQQAVAATIEAFGSLDLLINNAGINPHYGPMMAGDTQVASKILAVNVVAPFAWTQEAWRRWMEAHGGVVLNIASIGGVRPGQFIGFYNASKAALIHMTRQLALELAPRVRVNALAPAVVKTKFARTLYEGKEEHVIKGYPLGRLGTTRDVADAARFLLGQHSSWITGQVLVLDGGMSLVGWQDEIPEPMKNS